MRLATSDRSVKIIFPAFIAILFLCTQAYAGGEIPKEAETSDLFYALYFGGGLLALLAIGKAINGIVAKSREYDLHLVFSWQFAIQAIGGITFLLFYMFSSTGDQPISSSLVHSFATTFLLPAFVIAATGNIRKSDFIFGLIFTALQSLTVFLGVFFALFIKNSSSKKTTY